MGKVKQYNNLSLEEKLEYWRTYLNGLIKWNLSGDVPMRDGLIEEIVRVRQLIEVLDPNDIYNITIESKINTGKIAKPKKSISKKAIRSRRKSKEDYTTVYKFRYNSELATLVQVDEDRSKET